MTTLPLDGIDGLIAALATPLVSGGSTVLVVAPDHQRLPTRAETERVTHTAGVELPGVPALVSR